VLNHVAQSAGIECDDRSLAKKRFDSDEAEPLVDAWNDHGSSALIQWRKIGLR